MPLAAVVGLLLAAFSPIPALALDPVSETWRGIAIDGYDAVAYFTDGKAVEGSSDYTAEWKDALWRFSSAANRDRFAHAPTRYAPQYGGYCAWSVASGDAEDGDPELWKIVDGKLYLFASAEAQAQWEADIPGNASRADGNWPALVGDS